MGDEDIEVNILQFGGWVIEVRSLDAPHKGATRYPVGRISFLHPEGTDVQACLNLRAEQSFPALMVVVFLLSLLMWHGVRLHMGLSASLKVSIRVHSGAWVEKPDLRR